MTFLWSNLLVTSLSKSILKCLFLIGANSWNGKIQLQWVRLSIKLFGSLYTNILNWCDWGTFGRIKKSNSSRIVIELGSELFLIDGSKLFCLILFLILLNLEIKDFFFFFFLWEGIKLHKSLVGWFSTINFLA